MAETTTSAAPTVTGTLAERSGTMIVLGVPGTDYRLHLVLNGSLEAEINDRITGTIHANAKRVDVIPSGGRYIEPVFGRPRRIQGRIIGGCIQQNTIFVQAGGAAVICTVMPAQKTADFSVGQMVSFDVTSGATFEPIK